VKVLEPDPGAAKLAGAKLAVRPAGNMVHESATAELNPPLTVTFTWTAELAPGASVTAGAEALN
jgi:hypothetical protein